MTEAIATTPAPIASTPVDGAANDGSTASTPDPVEGQSVGILPEKFRGPDGITQMTKAYTEAEKELRKIQEERASLKLQADRATLLEQQLAIAQQAKPEPVASSQAFNEDEVFMKEWEDDPARAVLNQNHRVESRTRDSVQSNAQRTLYDSMKKDTVNYPDFAGYEPEMVALARQYAPLLRPDQLTNPDLIPLLYNVVQSHHIKDRVVAATAKATADAAALRSRKLASQVEGGSATASATGTTSFGDLSIKEMENLLGFVDR